MKDKILVVDDERDLRMLIVDFLVKEGYEVLETCDGNYVLDIVHQNEDLKCIVLDVSMPIQDGFTTLKELKALYSSIPVIMLTARNQLDDELKGFDLGVDDYVPKPFVAARLIARIKAVLKKNKLYLEDIFCFEQLSYNKHSCILEIADEAIELTPKEHELLACFILNKNIALTREKLLDKVWGFDYYGDIRTVDTHIKRLRLKMRDYAYLIKTVRGTGYRFEV